MEPERFQQGLLSWFDQHGRKQLPWQHPRSAYRVWVSEIMLQQTQVATVIPYFERFMARFPTVDALAAAPQDDVLALWAGLGYYARARNLHRAAQQIAQLGRFPETTEGLTALPGIGRSTAGAILSIAFNQPQAILDGNVKRVLTRCYGVHGWPGLTAVNKELWGISEQLTPSDRVADYTQAIMDLGATLCVRKQPRCNDCPFNPGCRALEQGLTADLPEPRPRKTTPVREGVMVFLRDVDGRFLLQKRPPAGIWGGLWCVPQLETIEQTDVLLEQLALTPVTQTALPKQRHTFSHYHLDFVPLLIEVCAARLAGIQEREQIWYHPAQQSALGLPTPVHHLINQITDKR